MKRKYKLVIYYGTLIAMIIAGALLLYAILAEI